MLRNLKNFYGLKLGGSSMHKKKTSVTSRGRNGKLLFETLENRCMLSSGPIVINELHVNPDIKTELVEFIELYNSGTSAVDLSGWYFSNGVGYTFANGTQISANQYMVIAENPAALQAKYGVSALGPYAGNLSNDGETVALCNSQGVVQDEVAYNMGFPWPTVGGAPGNSMELINPALDNDLGGSWRSSLSTTASQTALFGLNSQWQYFKGLSEPSTPYTDGAWRQRGFDDSSWLSGQTAIGYSNDAGEQAWIMTELTDMNGEYTSLYMRKTFDIANLTSLSSLTLQTRYDDGINVWINGQRVAYGNLSGENLPYTATSTTAIEPGELIPFTINNIQGYLYPTGNVIAVQLLNAKKSGSSDALFDCSLTATYAGHSGATPGASNSVYATNAPPQIRQVEHSPNEPVAGQDVVITAKVTDPNGVASVQLKYQLVNAGDYIAIDDARYNYAAYWSTATMYDNGTDGDVTAGDGIYTAVLSGLNQINRRLVRYRVLATDSLSASITVPYADDPQPNFAYYIYNGVPAWTGAINPGVTANVTYPASLMDDLPVFQLITTRVDHVDAQHIPNSTITNGYTGEDYLWQGALVYDGVVYDHITYRARGGVWRYAMGKNMWKFDFNTGHEFQARDNYGKKYDAKWSKLNLGSIIQQGDFWHRGEQGLFESVGDMLFNLAGVETSNTSFLQFRIVENASETGTTQYGGDLQGLYLAIEQVDGNFLDEHDMPDGNVYKMEGGTGTLNNQGPTQVSNGADLSAFLSTYTNTTPTDQWWRDNLDLESYYSYRSIVEAIHQYDIGYGKNYFYYNNPETNKWEVIPWDLDLTWANNMYGNGEEPFKSRVLASSRTVFNQEYRNRLREIRDLLYNSEQTGMLIDEFASFIYTPGQLSWVDIDRSMWDYNPIMNSTYVNSSKAGQGRYYADGAGDLPAASFAGMMQLMKNYVVSRGSWIDSTILTDNGQVPVKPTVTSVGQPGYHLDQLSFTASAYSSPVGSAAAAMEWRIAEITDTASPNFDPDKPRNYEITSLWESGELPVSSDPVAVPGNNLQVGDTYRVRVRFKDAAGRWGHWSTPVQFVAAAPAGGLENYLRVTEVMYNPPAPTVAESAAGYTDNNSFEYIELANTGSTDLQLSGVKFTLGVTYTFGTATLQPGQRILVVKNTAAFNFRYGTGRNIAGVYSGSLSNSGESIQLENPTGLVIQAFTYSDSSEWPGRADGSGASLESINTAGDYNDPDNWRSSSEYAGTPGVAGIGPINGVVVNEVLSHADYPLYDSIELYNTTNAVVDISGWYLSDNSDDMQKYRIPNGTLLGPYEYRVFTEEQCGISVFSAATQPGDGDATTDSTNTSLFLTGSNWRKIPLPYTVTANTVLEFDYISTNQGDIQGIGFDEDNVASTNRLFQLYGTTSWGISNYNNYSSSEPNLKHYTIPVGTFYTGSMSYLVFANGDASNDATSTFNNVKIYESTPGSTAAINFNKYFSLSAVGDDVWLMQADMSGKLTYFADHVSFIASINGESFGRWPNATGDLYPMKNRTFGQTNTIGGNGPRIGPLLISEVMYNPSVSVGLNPDDYEYIEIYNPTSSNVTLTNWRLRGGVDFDFPSGTVINTHATLLVLPFNPALTGNAQKLADFRSKYGIGASVKLVGGYSGLLDNGSATIQLQRPDSPIGTPATYPGLLEDEVHYHDASPWPSQADGGGRSLQRRFSAEAWGDDPASWIAAAPTPGSVSSTAVAGKIIFYNNSKFDGDGSFPNGDPAANLYDDNAVATNKQPLLPGATATFANYTSYTKGINGIIVDIYDLPLASSISAADFQFKVGNNADPAGWLIAPAPMSVTLRRGAGTNGSDRITIIWADNTIQNQWLQVTVLANTNTGLSTASVFYYGNAIAESGNNTANTVVDSMDELLALASKSSFSAAAITNTYDYNRDGRVTVADVLVARHNHTGGSLLQLITAPTGGPLAAQDALQLVSPPTVASAYTTATEPQAAITALPSSNPAVQLPEAPLSLELTGYTKLFASRFDAGMVGKLAPRQEYGNHVLSFSETAEMSSPSRLTFSQTPLSAGHDAFFARSQSRRSPASSDKSNSYTATAEIETLLHNRLGGRTAKSLHGTIDSIFAAELEEVEQK